VAALSLEIAMGVLVYAGLLPVARLRLAHGLLQVMLSFKSAGL
jgi:hypothetical protein